MSCDAGALLSVDDALQALLAGINTRATQEQLPLLHAQGRILAESVLASVDVPPADNSAMDGYAIRLADLAEQYAAPLPVSQRIPAGVAPTPLLPGTAARIFTGAELPAGADCVIMQEQVARHGDAIVFTSATANTGDNIRRRGQDMRAGQQVVAQGARLHPVALGALAAAGVSQVTVYKPLRVALFSSGDELRQPGEPLAPGQIHDANRFMLHALVTSLGMDVLDLGIIPDQPQRLREALQQAQENADVILTSAGVSVGEEDHLRALIESMGALTFWRVNLKPGKPFAAGRIGDTPIFALPGNPGSALVTFALLARPCLQALQGATVESPFAVRVPTAFAHTRRQSREEYVRVTRNADGALQRLPQQSSGTLFPLLQADGLARIPANTCVAIGEMLEFFPLRGWLT